MHVIQPGNTNYCC